MQNDLVRDFRYAIMEALPTRSYRERNAFASLDVREQAWRFMNWQSRLVHPHPRRVFRAIGFEASLAFQINRVEVNLLLARIAAGSDVEPHLSRGTKDGYFLHLNGRKQGPDFDLLLNEWAIHHLHLSSEREEHGFHKRTADLLFVIILLGEAYAVAVGTHLDWTAPGLIEEVIHSWPEKRFFVSLNVVPGQAFTPKEHLELRRAGVTTPAVVGEVAHICRLTFGLTTALVSMVMSREAARVVGIVREVSYNPRSVMIQLRDLAEQADMRWPKRPRLRVVRGSAPQRWAFGFLEENTGAALII